jgi:hypothetical protein
MNFTSTRTRQTPTVRITCDCSVCKGKAALLAEAKAQGINATITHNYVAMAGTPVGTALGVVVA